MRYLRRKPTQIPPTEAERAHLEAVVSLARTEARGAEVRRVSSRLREWRERNHIVEQLELILGGR